MDSAQELRIRPRATCRGTERQRRADKERTGQRPTARRAYQHVRCVNRADLFDVLRLQLDFLFGPLTVLLDPEHFISTPISCPLRQLLAQAL